jgi:hypothetical protein
MWRMNASAAVSPLPAPSAATTLGAALLHGPLHGERHTYIAREAVSLGHHQEAGTSSPEAAQCCDEAGPVLELLAAADAGVGVPADDCYTGRSCPRRNGAPLRLGAQVLLLS